MKIFDIHAHIYPDEIAPRAVKAISKGYDDIEVHGDGTAGMLDRCAEEAGIARMAVHSVATTKHQVESINRFVLSAAGRDPERMVPFGALHPDTEHPERAVDALVAGGFKGVKLHPEFQGFRVDEPRAIDMFGALAGRLPVLLHCGDYRCDHSAPERIRRMLREVRGLKLVCAHLGGWTNWEEAASQLMYEDVWVDTSSSIYAMDAETAAGIIRGYGADRVVFGTDYPVWDPRTEVERFMSLPLTEAEQRKILWTNHLRLLGETNDDISGTLRHNI